MGTGAAPGVPRIPPWRSVQVRHLAGAQPQSRISDWLVTNHRVAGRLYPDDLAWWQWPSVVGVKVDLVPRAEYVQIDLASHGSIAWTGAGVAPLAVATVFHATCTARQP